LFPYVFAIVSLLLGVAITIVARQQIVLAAIHKAEERERIARDLHDILGHTLSVIILKSELAGRLVEQNAKRAQAEIADVENISRKALAEVREAIRGYHAGDLPAEFARAQATLEAAGIVVERHYDKIDISAPQERVLVLALREAVTNIVRHAQAQHCRIQLRNTDGVYRLDVYDDGRGGVSEQGLGIRGMRHRVESGGGNVSWTSSAGTTLTITLPISSASSEQQ
jgi:two-component system sensor histidine kinase DesK